MGDRRTKGKWVSKVGQHSAVRKRPNLEIIGKREEFRAVR